MTYKEIGKILRQKRLEAGITQKTLAQLLEVDQERISAYELAKTRISIEFLQAFEALFSIPAGELSKHSNYIRKAPENNNELAQLRVKCGLTQKEVAAIFHISSTTFGAIEREEYNILSNEMKQIIPQIQKYLRNLALVKGKKVQS